MLPVNTPTKTYRSLDDIAQRKEELSAEMERDNAQASTLWGEVFVSRKEGTRSEFLSSVITNSITAIDAMLLVRKLVKNYGWLLGLKRKKKK
jgi:hypothetical protein